MPVNRLQLSGQLEGESSAPSGAVKYKREVLLCYEGEFESMDGPVVVTEEKLERIAQNYNAILARAKEVSKDGTIPDKFATPLQLDHSDSAKETVGRNYDDLKLAPYKKLDGSIVTGLYSYTTFIGKDNVENGSNGIWSNVSIGADFENGIFQELTITPFPAAAEASLLSKTAKRKTNISTINNGDGIMGKKEICLKYMMDKKEMSKEKAEEEYTKMEDGKIDEMCNKMKKLMEDTEGAEKKKLAAGDVSKMSAEDKEKVKKMAAAIDEEDDKKKLAAKEDEDKKKLAAEEDEEKKKLAAKKEEDDKKLAAGDVTKMSEEDKGAFKKMMSFMSKLMGGDDEDDKKKLAAGDVSKMSSEEKEEVKKMAAAIDKEDDEGKKLAAGNMKKKYMKKLMDDMDEDKAKDKMSKMSDEEIEKAVKKHEEDQSDVKKMAAGPRAGVRLSKADSDKITKLKGKFEGTITSTRLSVKKASIVHRLSSLRSQAKITPAEIKKLSVSDLAGKSKETIDEVFKTYEQRQPVINADVFGSTKAMDFSQLSSEVKASRLVKEEETHLDNMPSLKRMKENANKQKGDTTKITKLSGVAHMDRLADAVNNSDIPLNAITDKEIDEVQNNFDKMVNEGKLDEAKKLMAKTFSDVKRLRSVSGAEFSNQEDRIKGIEDSIEGLNEAFSSMIEIVNPILEK